MVSNSIIRAATFVPKGGVGKTTSSAHVGVSAATDHGLDVCLVDLAGTQNDLATQFGIAEEVDDPDIPISIVFSDNWEIIRDSADNLVERMVFETEEGVDLIPADNGLGAEDNNLANVPRENRYERLDAFVGTELANRYDMVVFDLPGKEDNITLNGLYAAENIIAPLKPGAFEANQLDNLKADLESIRSETEFGASPELQLVFATMVDPNTNLSERFVDELSEEYPAIGGPSIAKSANISAGQSEGRTLFAFNGDELYRTGVRARDTYRELTNDLLNRLEAR